MRHIALFALLILLIPTALLAQDNAASSDVPRFESAECPVDVPAEFASRVRCGVLTVPESRADGSDPTKTIRLPVAIISTTSAAPAPDPLIFPTAGGPGLSSFQRLDDWLYYGDWALQERDLVLIEQRGTRYAEPRLDCLEYDRAGNAALETALSPSEENALLVAGAQACRDRLVTEGVNLTAYNSAESASDVADLRSVLGFDQWNLYGISYGGRLALAIMRDHAEGLRSVILDSPDVIPVNRYEAVPPSFAAALNTLFADCAADPVCSELYPNLQSEFYEIVERHNQAPLPVTVNDPTSGEPLTLLLTGNDLTDGIFNALYDAQVIRILPFLIDQIYQGNRDVVQPLAQDTISQTGADMGMTFSVECSEEMPFNDPEAIAAALAAHPALATFDVFDEFPAICDLWGVPAAPPADNAPVVSDIPTLLLAGEYDPIHPAFWSETAAETLSNHYLYVFPSLGHAQIYSDSCPQTIATQFLHDPTTEPDTGCIDAMGAPDFLTTNDIYPTPAIYRLNSDVIEGGDPVQIGVLVVCIIAFVVALVYGLLSLVWRRGHVPIRVVAFAMLTTGLYLAFVVGLVLVLFNSDFLILGFGLPVSARPLLILPLVALAAGIILIALLARAWLRREGRSIDRIILSITAVASLVFALWLWSRGLLRV